MGTKMRMELGFYIGAIVWALRRLRPAPGVLVRLLLGNTVGASINPIVFWCHNLSMSIIQDQKGGP